MSIALLDNGAASVASGERLVGANVLRRDARDRGSGGRVAARTAVLRQCRDLRAVGSPHSGRRPAARAPARRGHRPAPDSHGRRVQYPRRLPSAPQAAASRRRARGPPAAQGRECPSWRADAALAGGGDVRPPPGVAGRKFLTGRPRWAGASPRRPGRLHARPRCLGWPPARGRSAATALPRHQRRWPPPACSPGRPVARWR